MVKRMGGGEKKGGLATLKAKAGLFKRKKKEKDHTNMSS